MNYNLHIHFFNGRNRVKVQLDNSQWQLIFPTCRRFVEDVDDFDKKKSVVYKHENLIRKYWGNDLFKYIVSSGMILDEEYINPHFGKYCTEFDPSQKLWQDKFFRYLGGKPRYDEKKYQERITAFVWKIGESIKGKYGIDVTTKRTTVAPNNFLGFKINEDKMIFVRWLESLICCDIDIRLIEAEYPELNGLSNLVKDEIPVEYDSYINIVEKYGFANEMGMIELISPERLLELYPAD